MSFCMAALHASLPSVAPTRVTVRPFSTAQRPGLRIGSFSGMVVANRLALRLPSEECSSSLVVPSNGSILKVVAMRHGKRVPRLGRPADQRKALLRALTTEVLRHGRITTTLPRAKAVRKYVDKMITLAKTGTLHARRQALGWVYDEEIVKSLFEEAPKRYAERAGGYTRVKKEVQPRRGDCAPMAVIELV